MKALAPCAVAAELEVVAGAEDEVLEEADEVGVVPARVLETEPMPVLEAELAPVLSAATEERVTPLKTRKKIWVYLRTIYEEMRRTTARHDSLPASRAACRSAPWHVFLMHAVVPSTKAEFLQRQPASVALQLPVGSLAAQVK